MDDSDYEGGYSEADEMEVDYPMSVVRQSVSSSSAGTSIQASGPPKGPVIAGITLPTCSEVGAHPDEYEKFSGIESEEDARSDVEDQQGPKVARITGEVKGRDGSLGYRVQFENGKETEVGLSSSGL